jgi:SPW repeat
MNTSLNAPVGAVDHSRQTQAASGINFLLGIWLIISPWVIGYAAAATGVATGNVIVGALILIFGAVRNRSPHMFTGLSWANIVLGAWTFFSPWIYNFASSQAYIANSVIVGIAVVVLAVWSGSATVMEHRVAAR